VGERIGLFPVSGELNYRVPDAKATLAAIEARYPVDDRRPENSAIQKLVAAMQSLGPISRTQIEWQIDGAVSAVAGNNTADLREVIRRAKQLVVELSRRPA